MTRRSVLQLLLTITFLLAVQSKYAELPRNEAVLLDPAAEAADEKRDVEIFQAVVNSMRAWERKRNRTRTKRSQGSVCYGDLGCFEDSGPYSYLEMLPSPPQEINTRFLLYSTSSRASQPLADVSARNSSAAWRAAAAAVKPHLITRVIVHGFGSSCENVWVYEMRSALMAVEECNVICVDWEGGAVIPNYVRAAANTRLVGRQLAMLLENLSKNIGLKYHNVHLIGFSLGAHVAGFAGSQLPNISRITGLDPAGPLFEFQDTRVRLDSDDANFVDVIHSNGENLILGGLGSWQQMGHVDFYPNGGRMQTGCSNLFVGAVSDILWSPSIEARSLCNHRRAYKFFTDSVSPKCHFPAFPCSTYDDFLTGKCFPCAGGRRCGNMGYYADRSTGRGQLYLVTREEEPFCAHQYHVTIDSSKVKVPSVSYGKITFTLIGETGLNESFTMTKKEDSELVADSILGRMIVPHPALGAPAKVQLAYTAYSGWLSSGAPSWTVIKVLVADSFGTKSSVCKSGLTLMSGEPVTLPLHSGDCQINQNVTTASPKNTTKSSNSPAKTVTNSKPRKHSSLISSSRRKAGEAIIHNADKKSEVINPMIKQGDTITTMPEKTDNQKNENAVLKSEYNQKPTIMQMGKHFKIKDENKPSQQPDSFSIFDAAEILNLPWQPLLGNAVDDSPNERESGRAFGSTNIKPIRQYREGRQNVMAVEIVEPVLRARLPKTARSQNLQPEVEISEPILGPTTGKPKPQQVDISKRIEYVRKPKVYHDTASGATDNFVKSVIPLERNNSGWVPYFSTSQSSEDESTNFIHDKRNDSKNDTTSKSDTFNLLQWTGKKLEDENNNGSESGFTVQFLPSRLVSFLERAERYARTTLLPLVSAYTPRFLMFGNNEKIEMDLSDDKKYIPTNSSSELEMDIPQQSQEEKIETLKVMKPPGMEVDSKISDQTKKTNLTQIQNRNNSIPSVLKHEKELGHLSVGGIKIVNPPYVSTTTTLRPVTVQSATNSSEKVIIVYPSNARDDRKVQSHTFPELMQFEVLYQQAMNPIPALDNFDSNLVTPSSESRNLKKVEVIQIDLPTYMPARSTTPSYGQTVANTSTPLFIPVSYPLDSP